MEIRGNFKPDKGNGVVLINNVDFYQLLEHLFIDKKKFKQIDKDLTTFNITKLFKIIIETR